MYRKTLSDLCALTGKKIKVLHVVGGGSQADFLNQLTASATGIPILAGPVEATALGNALAQFLATGVISSLAYARALIGNSFAVKRFEPEPMASIEAAYSRFTALTSD
jgi:rhamnulokinase